MYPLSVSAVIPGLPIKSLFRETPLAAIWKRADSGQIDEEAVRRPKQVVYSEFPSVTNEIRAQNKAAWKLTVIELKSDLPGI
jgi:hypothetical protein